MTILQQVEIVVFMPYFRSIATNTLTFFFHKKYDAHIKGFPICFRDLQAKNEATDSKFVTLWLHLKGMQIYYRAAQAFKALLCRHITGFMRYI